MIFFISWSFPDLFYVFVFKMDDFFLLYLLDEIGNMIKLILNLLVGNRNAVVAVDCFYLVLVDIGEVVLFGQDASVVIEFGVKIGIAEPEKSVISCYKVRAHIDTQLSFFSLLS